MDTVDNPQLQLAFNFVQYTNRNVFLTGKAGTGKTTFLHNLKKVSPKRMIVVAPTGVAAINAGGVTIHSFFQLPFGPFIPNNNPDSALIQNEANSSRNNFHKFNRDKKDIIKSLDLLVIDEISMVRADLLDGIDDVLRRFKDKSKPFGGVQLLMIGDIQQLAPVIKDDEWHILKDWYQTIYFFSSRALLQTQYVSVELKHIYRQNDAAFIALLNKVRENQLDAHTINELNKQYNSNFAQNAPEGYITLTTHNSQAQGLNERKLLQINTKAYKYKATVQDDFPEYAFPTDLELTLKVGAQVMFIKNDSSREKLFYNGKIGIIENIDDDIIYVKCATDYEQIAVGKVTWDNTKYTINEQTKEIQETIAGTFTQYPLKLAWAITIHKSQGLTFERAIIDANSAFAHGQVYVALSRCKTLEGMVLSTPLSLNSVKSDSTVQNFSRNIELNPPDNNVLISSKFEYQQQLLSELFDFWPIHNRLGYCNKLCTENLASLHVSFTNAISQAQIQVRSLLIDVAEKFKAQIKQFLAQQANAEDNEPLQERLKKACPYFIDKIDNTIHTGLNSVSLESDNKTVKKAINEVLIKINTEIGIKKACLKACSNGFTVKNYLDQRAKASIEKPEIKIQAKLTGKIPEMPTPTTFTHPKLFALLKSWRMVKADEIGQPPFVVLHQKPLIELVETLPSTINQLATINGLGKHKIKTYGAELLEIINQYCTENSIIRPEPSIEKNINFETTTKPKKEKTPNTRLLSFELFKSGKSVPEIALERGFAVSTIEGHLAEFVLIGQLKINELVPNELVMKIKPLFEKHGIAMLAPIKEELGEAVTYGELKLVQAYIRWEEKHN